MGRAIPVLVGVAVLGIGMAVLVRHQDAPTARPPGVASSTARSAGTPSYDVARARLKVLPVRGWDLKADFGRYRFGQAWSDDVNVEFGHNGCNTRDDILRRDLDDLVVRPGTCYAQTGVLQDPYSGQTIA